MNYELLEGTRSVKVVTPKQFARALYDNETRGYNYYKVNFYDDYISLSAPLPHGVHHTLVLTKSTFEEYYGLRSTVREYYADFLEQDYIPILEEETFNKVIEFVKEKINDKIDTLDYWKGFKVW